MAPEFEYYTISRVLGEGGMGLVYLAHDRRTGLPVAIKVMSKREFDPELQARFLKENRILSALNHRNIVRCYEITESLEGMLSIVMEYVDGVDFRAFEGRPYPELLPLMIQALMGLAYLRGQNIVHRDLSSNNVFVTLENQTRVTKILDFGVAKILQQQAVPTPTSGRGRGSSSESSRSPRPSSSSRRSIDWRSDVYSLGVIFHRLLTKTPPIKVGRKRELFRVADRAPGEQRLRGRGAGGRPAFAEALPDIVRRMLARSPDDRPQSYEEIIDVLDRFSAKLSAGLEPDPLASRRFLRRSRDARLLGERRNATPSSPSVSTRDRTRPPSIARGAAPRRGIPAEEVARPRSTETPTEIFDHAISSSARGPPPAAAGRHTDAETLSLPGSGDEERPRRMPRSGADRGIRR